MINSHFSYGLSYCKGCFSNKNFAKIRHNNFNTAMRRVVQTSIDKFKTIETTMLLYILEACLVVNFKIRPHKIN